MRTRLASTILLALTFSLAAAGARAFDRCEPFSVFTDHDAHEVTYVDLGETGQSVGDRRVFHAPLHDGAGKVVGRVDGESSVIHSDDDGNAQTISTVVYQFPDGVIVYMITPSKPARDFADASGPLLPSADAARIIIGGSGVFAGASGSVNAVRGDKTTEVKVNVFCRQ